MSGSGKAGNGRGNNRRRPFRRRDKGSDWQDADAFRRPSPQGNSQGNTQGSSNSLKNSSPDRNDTSYKTEIYNRGDVDNHGRRGIPPRKGVESPRNQAAFIDRPKWIPPKVNTDPLPVPDCRICGKPIRDLPSALADRDTGAPVHFDCVTAGIADREILEKGETIAYLGGGRFGVIRPGYQDSQGRAESQGFKIKKIIEWENNEKRAEWRSLICDHYSVT